MLTLKQKGQRQHITRLTTNGEFGNAVPTPYTLASDLIGKVDLSDKNILVIYNLEFVLTMIQEYSVKPEQITVYGESPAKERLCNLLGVNYITSFENAPKIDVIFGNPPYQNRTETGQAVRWSMWHKFLDFAVNSDAETVAFIVPASVASPGKQWDSIRNHLVEINLDAGEHFKNVGSTFCSFILNKKSIQTNTKIISDGKEYNLNVTNLPCLPPVFNQESLDALNWLLNRERRTWKRGELHTQSHKEHIADSGKYTIMHTNAKTLYTDFEHENKSKLRVAVTLSGYPRFNVIENMYCSQAMFWTEFDTRENAEAFAAECNDTQIQKIMAAFKWSGWNSKEIIELL